MPEMVCVKRKGVSYCWNLETLQLEIFTKESISAEDCPADVLRELLVLVSEKASKDR